MKSKIYIDATDLTAMLLDDNSSEATLEKYFELDDSKAFSINYKIRENVFVDRDSVVNKSFLGESVLSLANWIARRKRLKKYKKSLKKYPNRIRIVSEGDSWFQHPMIKETIDHIENRFSVLSLGAAGDDMADYFRLAEYKDAIDDENPKFFLFSGGGNDLMGGHFDDYLNDYSVDTNNDGPSRFLNVAFDKKIKQLMNMYNTIFLELKKNHPSIIMLVHGYDYVIPGDKKNGKWLGKFLESKGITSKADKKGVIKVLIDTFNKKLSMAASNYKNVEYIDVRNTVNNNQWHDEIHPDKYGFEQVAIRFLDRMNKLI